jgi:hypothetical protein
MSRSRKTTSPQLATGSVALLIGTRKGAFILRGDPTRRTWKLSAPMFLGHIVHHVVLDPSKNWRNDNFLGKDPASTKVKYRPVDPVAHAQFAAEIRTIPPEKR